MADPDIPGSVPECTEETKGCAGRRLSLPAPASTLRERRGSQPIDFKLILMDLDHEISQVGSETVTRGECTLQTGSLKIRKNKNREQTRIMEDDRDLIALYTRDLEKLERDGRFAKRCEISVSGGLDTCGYSGLCIPETRERSRSFSHHGEDRVVSTRENLSRPRANTLSTVEYLPRPPTTPRRLSVDSTGSLSPRLLTYPTGRRRLSTASTGSEGYHTLCPPSPLPADSHGEEGPHRQRAATYSGQPPKKYIPVGLRRRFSPMLLSPPETSGTIPAEPSTRRRHTISFSGELKLLAKNATRKVSTPREDIGANMKPDIETCRGVTYPINHTIQPLTRVSLTCDDKGQIDTHQENQARSIESWDLQSGEELISPSSFSDFCVVTSAATDQSHKIGDQDHKFGDHDHQFGYQRVLQKQSSYTNESCSYSDINSHVTDRQDNINISCLNQMDRHDISCSSTSTLGDSDTNSCDCHRHCISITVRDHSQTSQESTSRESTIPTSSDLPRRTDRLLSSEEPGKRINSQGENGGEEDERVTCFMGDNGSLETRPEVIYTVNEHSCTCTTGQIHQTCSCTLGQAPVMDYKLSVNVGGDFSPKVPPAYWVNPNQCLPSRAGAGDNRKSDAAGAGCLARESLVDLMRRSSSAGQESPAGREGGMEELAVASLQMEGGMGEPTVPSLQLPLEEDPREPELAADTDYVSSTDKLFTPRQGESADSLVPFDRLLKEAELLLPQMASIGSQHMSRAGADLQEDLRLWDLEADLSMQDEDDDSSSLCMTSREMTMDIGDFTIRSGALSRMDAATRLEMELGIQLHDADSKSRQSEPPPDLPHRDSGIEPRLGMANQHATGALSGDEGEEDTVRQAREGEEDTVRQAREGEEETVRQAREGEEDTVRQAREGEEDTVRQAIEGEEQNPDEQTKPVTTGSESEHPGGDKNNGYAEPQYTDNRELQFSPTTVATTSINQTQIESSDESSRCINQSIKGGAAKTELSNAGRVITIKGESDALEKTINTKVQDQVGVNSCGPAGLGNYAPSLINKPNVNIIINGSGSRNKLKEQITPGLSPTSVKPKHNIDHSALMRDWRTPSGRGVVGAGGPADPGVPSGRVTGPGAGIQSPHGGIPPSNNHPGKQGNIDPIHKEGPEIDEVSPPAGVSSANTSGVHTTHKHKLSTAVAHTGLHTGETTRGNTPDKNISLSLNESALRKYNLSRGSGRETDSGLGRNFVPKPPSDASKMTVTGTKTSNNNNMDTAKLRPKSSKGRSRRGMGPPEDIRANRPQSAWRSRYRRPNFTADSDTDDDIDSDVEVLDLDRLDPPSSPDLYQNIPGTNTDTPEHIIARGDDPLNGFTGDKTTAAMTTIKVPLGKQTREPIMTGMNRELELYMQTHMPEELNNDPPYAGGSKSRRQNSYQEDEDGGSDPLLPEVIYNKAAERVVEKYRRRAMTDHNDVRTLRRSTLEKVTSSMSDAGPAPRKLKPILHKRSYSKDKVIEDLSRVAADEAYLSKSLGSALEKRPQRRSSTPDIYRHGNDIDDVINSPVPVPHNKLAPLRKDRREEGGKVDRGVRQRLQPLPAQKEAHVRVNAHAPVSGSSPPKMSSPKIVTRTVSGSGEEVTDLSAFEARLDAELRNFGVPARVRKNSKGSMSPSPRASSPTRKLGPSPRASSPTRKLGPSPRVSSPTRKLSPSPRASSPTRKLGPRAHKPLHKTQSGGGTEQVPYKSPSRKHSRNLSDSHITTSHSASSSPGYNNTSSPGPGYTSSSPGYTRRAGRDPSPRPMSRAGRTEPRVTEAVSRQQLDPVSSVHRTPRSVEESPRSNTPSSNPPNPRAARAPGGINPGKPPPAPLGKSLGSSDFRMRQNEMMAQMMAELGGATDFPDYASSTRRQYDDL